MARFSSAAGALVGSARGEPGDRYVVVTSTPDSIGQSQDIPTAANSPSVRLAAATYVPIIIPASPDGPMTNAIQAVLAHSGVITVTAVPFITMP